MTDVERIDKFIEIFKKTSGAGAPYVPKEMSIDNNEHDEWAEWKAVDSPVNIDDLDKYEAELNLKLPSLFKCYLTHKCLLMTEFIVILPQTPYDKPLEDFDGYINVWREQPYFKRNKLIPFGYEPNIGTVCFNADVSCEDNNYSICIVDTYKVNDPSYKPETHWSSFSDLLKCIEKELLSYE